MDVTTAQSEYPLMVECMIWDLRVPALIQAHKVHTSIVTGVAFHPSGQSVLSGSSDGSVALWDIRVGKSAFALSSGNGPILSIGISPQGNMFLTCNKDHSIGLWNFSTEISVRTLSNPSTRHRTSNVKGRPKSTSATRSRLDHPPQLNQKAQGSQPNRSKSQRSIQFSKHNMVFEPQESDELNVVEKNDSIGYNDNHTMLKQSLRQLEHSYNQLKTLSHPN